MSDTPRSDFVWDHFQKCGGPYRLTNVSQQLERELTNIQRKLALAEARVKELEVIRHAALELAQYASYAEIVGRVSLNREQIREWSDKIFKLNLDIGEAMPRKDS
jgi:hypothetical protein